MPGRGRLFDFQILVPEWKSALTAEYRPSGRGVVGVSELESKVREYYKLRPTDYSVVRQITLSQGAGPGGVFEQRLSVVLQRRPGSAVANLYLEFYGVQKLMLQQPMRSLLSIGHIEIRVGGAASNGSNNFIVIDPEQEQVIRFECRDFEAHIG